jgi:hypothetical protein
LSPSHPRHLDIQDDLVIEDTVYQGLFFYRVTQYTRGEQSTKVVGVRVQGLEEHICGWTVYEV